MRFPSLVVLLVAPALALSACGSDDDEPTRTALPKADYLKASEAICAKGKAQADSLDSKVKTAKDFTREFPKYLDFVDRETTQLEELAAVQPDAALLKAILTDPLRAQVSAIQAAENDILAATKAGRAPAIPPTPKVDPKRLKAYGFVECVKLTQQ